MRRRSNPSEENAAKKREPEELPEEAARGSKREGVNLEREGEVRRRVNPAQGTKRGREIRRRT